jgi:hypothetical protein
MSGCYNSYKKKDLIETGMYVLKQTCCDETSCSELAEDLKDLQYKCNDLFRDANQSEADAKGNIKGTLCEDLQNKKIYALNEVEKFRVGSRGGKKIKRQTKKRKKRSGKSRKNIKKSTKYRRSKK